MKIANADKLKHHFEHVVMVKNFTVPEILTIIDTFSKEVSEGKWLDQIEPFGYSEFKVACCDQCHESYVLNDEWGIDDVREEWHYCPNCGAHMVGGTKP